MGFLSKERIVKALGNMKTPEQRNIVFNEYRDAIQTGNKSKAANAANHLMALVSAPFVFANEIAQGREAVAGAIQAFSTTSDLPQMVTNGFDVFREIENVDNRALESFKIRQFDEGYSFFEILNIQNGLTVSRKEVGEPVKYSKISGDKAQIDAVTFGGGFQWDWELIEDRKYNTITDMVADMTMGTMRSKGKELYGLLQTAALANATLALPAGATAFEQGIKAINEAAENVSLAVKDEVWADSANAPMKLYVHAGDSNVAFLRSLLGYTTVYNGTTNTTITSRQIELIPTHNLDQLAAGEAMLVLPGGKTQYADKVMPTSYTSDDIDHFATKQTVRMRYGAAAADNRQMVVVTYK